MEPEKQTSPPQSTWCPKSYLFFSLCQTVCGEINWWVHAGNRVAIETSHIRLVLEFVTREKSGERERARERQRGGCVEYSLERHQRWSHLQHNVNAMFYFSSPIYCVPHLRRSIHLKSPRPATGLEEASLDVPAQYIINIKVDTVKFFVMRLWKEEEKNWTINYSCYPSAEHPLPSMCPCVRQIITLGKWHVLGGLSDSEQTRGCWRDVYVLIRCSVTGP